MRTVSLTQLLQADAPPVGAARRVPGRLLEGERPEVTIAPRPMRTTSP